MLVFHEQTLDSTSTRAAELAAQHPGEIILVSAERQTAGRGRMGRKWQSPNGGAWLSMVWPSHQPPAAMQAAPLVVGLAVCEAVVEIAGGANDIDANLSLKWPNDLLINEQKIAGILCEQILGNTPNPQPPDQPLNSMILGVGINANIQTSSLHGELRHPPASLIEICAKPVDTAKLITLTANHMVRHMKTLETSGFTTELHRLVTQRLAWVSQPVALELAGNIQSGICLGIDPDGKLLIRTPDGQTYAHASGEISRFRRA